MYPRPEASHVFSTPLGRCAVVWGSGGLTAVLLPGFRRLPAPAAKPPAWVQRAVTHIRALLAGRPNPPGHVRLDERGLSPFQRRVYRALRRVGPGRTVSYGELAARTGVRGAARAVGRALGANPWPLLVPCHRVLRADGTPGGFSGPGGVRQKLKILALESRSGGRGDDT